MRDLSDDALDDRILKCLEKNEEHGLSIPQLAKRTLGKSYANASLEEALQFDARILWLENHGFIHTIRGVGRKYNYTYWPVYRIAGNEE